jgi:GT2 family glycosyltransferase
MKRAPPRSRPARRRVGAGELVLSALERAARALRERRLPLSPSRWLRNLVDLHQEMSGEPARRTRARLDEAQASRPDLEALHRAKLELFLASGASLLLEAAHEPRVSIVLVLFNRAELTLACLRSLAGVSLPVEVLIVDNASSDQTGELLGRLEGARVVRQPENVGFLRACNLAAGLATGRHLLFLNNDAELLPGALESAVATLDGDPSIGAVGARLIAPDGRLQEAGSIIFRDGSCAGYGRGEDPLAPDYSFQRDVDYCSGAFLLTPRTLFVEAGGFDERFAPAYYEDADYCVRLWKKGRRVVYQPAASVIHVEFASARSRSEALRLQEERRARFCEKHADWLAGRAERADGQLQARAHGDGLRVLFVDDRVPDARHGSGHPRALSLVRALVDAGHFVTCYPTRFPDATADGDLPATVEVMSGWDASRLGGFLRDREGYYDRIVVSRPNNMRLLQALAPPVRTIYDAEAIWALRDLERERLHRGDRVAHDEAQRQIAEETALARGAQVVLAVSEAESRHFRSLGHAPVITLGHAIEPAPGALPFAERAGLLFVGAFYTDRSPNSDALFWFVDEVWPRVRERLPGVTLTVAGSHPTERVLRLARPDLRVLGEVADVASLYHASRMLVAPTRFAAGLPYKVHHAAAHGLPVVCTSLLAKQLGWSHQVEALVADSPTAFAEACLALHQDAALWLGLRQAALERVTVDCSRAAFSAAVAAALAGDE